MWKLNNTLLSNQWVKEEIKREIKKKNLKNGKQYTKLMGCCKSNSKIKFIVIKTYMKKKERSQTNNLTLNLKEQEAQS